MRFVIMKGQLCCSRKPKLRNTMKRYENWAQWDIESFLGAKAKRETRRVRESSFLNKKVDTFIREDKVFLSLEA